MTVFECLDGTVLSQRILAARRRVVLCMPGFDDAVGTALIAVSSRLAPGNVTVVVDGGDQAARMGYGHFDALKEVSDAGLVIGIETGLRLGVVVIDDQGWCFAAPPLMVDATMEAATAPNAMRLAPAQVDAVLAAVMRTPAAAADAVDSQEPAAPPEIGRRIATVGEIERTHAALQADQPQRFDIARKVTVFNAFVEFVELELLGTQLGRQRVALPPALLLAVSDRATRDRLTTSFQLIAADSELGKRSKALRRRVDEIRKEHTRAIGAFRSIGLRANRPRLDKAIEQLRADLGQFHKAARERLQKEIERSRKQLIESVLPGLKKSPPEALLSSIVGKPTVEQLRRWIDQQLDRAFPPLDRLLMEMKLTVAYKGVTYETLTDHAFQDAVRRAYPLVDFDKPFREFTAARSADA